MYTPSDLLMFIGDCSIANHADDTIPYTLGRDLNSVISKLEDFLCIFVQGR